MRTFTGLRAIAYLRWSRDEQAKSLEQQKSVISTWAKENGVTILDYVIDDGVSGTLDESRRKGLARLIRMIEERTDFAFVVGFDLSRFGRFQDFNAYGYFFMMAHKRRKFYYFIDDRCASNDREIERVIMRVIKELEAAGKSRTVATGAIRGQVARALKGHVAGGFPPYGFDFLVIDQREQPVEIHRLIKLGPRGAKQAAEWEIRALDGSLLRPVVGSPKKQRTDDVIRYPGLPQRIEAVLLMFTMYARYLGGFREIAGELNRMGYATYRGGSWRGSTVRMILRNPAYRGTSRFNKDSSAKVFRIEMHPDDQGNPYTRVEPEDWERERVRPNPEKDWIMVEGAHEVLIPLEITRLVDERLAAAEKNNGGGGKEAAGRNPRSSRSTALLAGFLMCKRCGHHLVAQWSYRWMRNPVTGEKARLPVYNAYICGSCREGGPTACPKVLVPREAVEEPVLSTIRTTIDEISKSDDWRNDVRRVLDRYFHAGIEHERRQSLVSRKEELEGRAQALVRGVSPENVKFLNEELNRLRTEIEGLDREIALLPDPAQGVPDTERAIDEVLAITLDLRRTLEEGGTPEARRRALEAFLGQVTIDPEKKSARFEMFRFPLPEGVRCALRSVALPTGLANSSPPSDPEGWKRRVMPPTGFEPVLQT